MSTMPGSFHCRFWLFGAVLLMALVVLSSCGLIPGLAPKNPTETPMPTLPPDSGVPVSLKDGAGIAVSNGVIRVTGSSQSDDSDNGEYRIGPCGDGQMIVAWAPGYKTSFARCDGNVTQYDIVLFKLDTVDNPNYPWAAAGIESDLAPNCAGCHSEADESTHNEFGEWRLSGHARVVFNRFFETVYLGTNLNGSSSPGSTWDIMDDQVVRHAPTLDVNYRGPGYKLDFPTKNGNCGYCHMPAAVGADGTDVNLARYLPNPGGSVGEGITCDVCHKVTGLLLDDNRYPYVDRPGIQTFQFLRPRDVSDRLVFGPLASFATVNSPSHSSACSPVFSQSEFCAACHYGKFFSTVIYGSYDEWRKSEYGNDPASDSYQTCQDCHMSRSHAPQEGKRKEREACSAENINNHDYDHNMLDFGRDEATGRDIPRMIQGAGTVNAEFSYDATKKTWLTVTAKVRSKNVGHRFPTDSPLRHLILVVEVRDERGTLMAQVDGDRIPIWGGAGDITAQNPNVKLYAGLPGKIFSNLLVEEDTNVSPTTSYWNETKHAWTGVLSENPYDYSDTRLRPGIVDTSKYSFDVPEKGNVTVTLRLVYRFAFYDLMRQKGWERPDIEVTARTWDCARLNEPAGFDCKAQE